MSKKGPTTPIQAGQVKKGMFAMLKDRPCKVIDVSVSKTGKHGHAKARLTGTDVFNGKKYEDIKATWTFVLDLDVTFLNSWNGDSFDHRLLAKFVWFFSKRHP